MNAGLALILRALAFAAHRHRDQRRKGPEAWPYINHPIALADLLCTEAQVDDPRVLAAAILHDTLEDTRTNRTELESLFGHAVAAIGTEVSDDKTLPKQERKRLQVLHAQRLSGPARLVKLADKICNLRDIAASPPLTWSLDRRREYFDWAKEVVDEIRGSHAVLESIFDATYRLRP